ncbi:MAG: tRNA 4-thiouridine(8) synthase ThiI, partial [Solobacterium sp.]|nr:tRNA 4-thiouridine(8) synthase ThiI [Solobacterium sp.]
MAIYDTVLIRYGELTTKGKNRKDFIRKLDQNIRGILKDFEGLQFRRGYDRYYITLNGNDAEAVKEKLKKVFGISSFSFTERVDTDINVITRRCLELAEASEAKTFKMITRRHYKGFEMNSDAINRHVAGVILANTDKKVDV